MGRKIDRKESKKKKKKKELLDKDIKIITLYQDTKGQKAKNKKKENSITEFHMLKKQRLSKLTINREYEKDLNQA